MVAALNFHAKKGFGPFASIPTASQHVPFSAADGHQPMTAQRCQNRPSRWFTEAVGKRPKSNCLTIIKRPAGRTSRSSYLYATAPLDRPVSERDLEVLEFGLRDA
jgi:hypothetical protein